MIDTATEFSRRRFLTQASYFGAFYAIAGAIPLPGLAASLSDDPRIAATPIVDAGFASVRKIGAGAYATISETSKGLTTMCNGGFVVGKDAALLLEGFVTPNGAAFQMDALRKVSQAPAAGALDTHYHFDHSCGNSFYGANGIQLWAHASVGKRITESYEPMQIADKAAILGSSEKRVQQANSELHKQHAQSDLNALTGVVDIVKKTTLTLPNRPLDPAKLPLTVDLGGYPIVIEHFPGHSGTDLIVRVPEQKVVYAGDLLFNGMYPVCFDEKATISGWRATLKTFASFDKDTIFVPGHGQICGQEAIALLRNVFDDIAEQAEKMHKAGVPATEAVDRYIVPDKFKTLGIFAWGFTIGPAITKLYAEWDAK
jgi:glyoxylase-like metal-dependent hydrolase (beta-lactamase superfamily II)